MRPFYALVKDCEGVFQNPAGNGYLLFLIKGREELSWSFEGHCLQRSFCKLPVSLSCDAREMRAFLKKNVVREMTLMGSYTSFIAFVWLIPEKHPYSRRQGPSGGGCGAKKATETAGFEAEISMSFDELLTCLSSFPDEHAQALSSGLVEVLYQTVLYLAQEFHRRSRWAITGTVHDKAK